MAASKIAQAEIDQLLQTSSQDEQRQTKVQKSTRKKISVRDSGKDVGIKKNREQNQYGDDFEQEVEQPQHQQPQPQVQAEPSQVQNQYENQDFEPETQRGQQAQPSKPKHELDAIESEYASEAIDDVAESLAESIAGQQGENNRSGKSGTGGDRDDELSLAQSEFIESGNMQGKGLGKFSKGGAGKEERKPTETGKQQKNAKKNVQPRRSKGGAQTDKKPAKPLQKTAKPKAEPEKLSQTKAKRSEQEIKQALKAIQDQKKQIEQARKKKQQQQIQNKKRIYEQALAKENQRKEKNKQILAQQKRKNENRSDIKKSSRNIDEEARKQVQQPKQVKEYHYKQMTMERKKAQKQIQKTIQAENQKKLRELEVKVEAKKVQAQNKKHEFLKVRDTLKQAKINQKKLEEKEEDVLMVKKIKKEMKQIKQENEQKKKKIFQFDKAIQALKKQLKQKQKKYTQIYIKNDQASDSKTPRQHIVSEVNISDLSPVQKFVSFFPEAQNAEQIFNMLDQNKDGILSTQEILQKIRKQGVPQTVAQQIHQLLDKNSDGELTPQQFAFSIETELQKQRDYRSLMGGIQLMDPIDIEASILDMRAKIQYMNRKILDEGSSSSNPYEQKCKQYMEKISKIQALSSKHRDKQKVSAADLAASNTRQLLMQEHASLENKLGLSKKLLATLRQNFNANLNAKNKTLMIRIEQNLQLQEQVFRTRNQIQETQLRFISLRKIEQNKRGYLEKMSQQRIKMEELYSRAQEYQVRIADPTKQLKNRNYARDVELLAAVIMIQRNYRKRKAMRLYEQKKQQAG